VEARGGRPAVVKGTEDKDGEGLPRIEFRDNDRPEDIDWNELFKTFEDLKLAFPHQEKTSDGKLSRFFRFVRRDGHLSFRIREFPIRIEDLS
jgi:hypothetical protein